MNRIILTLLVLIMHISVALAGPGGQIAKAVFSSPAGKIVAIILTIIFFPFILHYLYQKYIAVQKTKKQLQALSKVNYDLFDEVSLKNRVSNIFQQVHRAWSDQNVADSDAYMTHWYRQNQQTVFLDQWASKGLINICNIKKIIKLQPIHLRLSDDPELNKSRVMYAITAEIEDYMTKVEDSSVIEGMKGYKDVETVWTFQLVDGHWKVDNIEQSDMISQYLKMKDAFSKSKIKALRQISA